MAMARKLLLTLLAILPIIQVTACAPSLKSQKLSKDLVQQEAEKQRQMTLELQSKRNDRLLNVSFKLRSAATELCDDPAKVIGINVHDLSSYPKEFRAAAHSLWGLDDRVVVRYVQPEFPAALSGIAPGDTLVAVNRQSFRNTEDAMRLLAKAADSQDMVRLEFRTPAGSRVNMVRFKDVVKYPVLPTQDDIVNAFADGDKVYIASGMMRFAESDEELALVVGHEIAHNCLGHISKQKGNMLLGGLLDAVVYAGTGVDTGNVFASAGGQAFSQSFESEADYMGIYLAKRAGYDVEHAPAFWRRMAAEHPGSIKQNFGSSHPSTPERFLALEATVKEIDAKTAARLPLVPDPKGVEAD